MTKEKPALCAALLFAACGGQGAPNSDTVGTGGSAGVTAQGGTAATTAGAGGVSPGAGAAGDSAGSAAAAATGGGGFSGATTGLGGGAGASGGAAGASGGAAGASGGAAGVASNGGTAGAGVAGSAGAGGSPASMRPRIIVTTDGEVDDRSSMIRYLLYTNDFDTAGIVEVNSRFQEHGHSDERWIEEQLDEYAKILPNLRVHDPDYPDATYLRSIMRVGNETEGDLTRDPPDMATKNTAGEKLIIDTLLDDDPRPVHVVSWGGANTTASALWRLKYTGEYSEEQFDKAVEKIRIYCIWYQDAGGGWIQNNVKEAYLYEAYKWDNVWDYQSVSGDANPSEVKDYMRDSWLRANVTSAHGSLGALYPQSYVSEGDTPSFLHLVDNGLDAHLDYTLGGWGGRAVFDNPGNEPNHLTDEDIEDDGDPNKMFWRWVIPAQNDFAARMDWSITSSFTDANHAPKVAVRGGSVQSVVPGQTVTLDGSGTMDPDGDGLRYNWWQYAAADSASATITIANDTSTDGASFVVPDEVGKQVQIILEVTDEGEPPLKGYRRILFDIQ